MSLKNVENKENFKEDIAIMRQVRLEIQKGFDITLKQGKDGTIKVIKTRPQVVNY